MGRGRLSPSPRPSRSFVVPFPAPKPAFEGTPQVLHLTPKGPAEGSYQEVLFELSWIGKNELTVQMYLTDKASGCYSQRLGFSCRLRLQVCLIPEGRRLNCGIVGLNQLRVGYLGISRKG